MHEIIGLATDASEVELPAIRATLKRMLGFSPREPQPGTWIWYGCFGMEQLDEISFNHQESAFWLEWDCGELCAGQYVAHGGEIEHMAVFTGEDDDELVFEYGICYDIRDGVFDRKMVRRLPANRPCQVKRERWPEYRDDEDPTQVGSGDPARHISWERLPPAR